MNFFSEENGIHLEYYEGGVLQVKKGHTTGWRSIPCVITAQFTNGPCRLRVESGDGSQIEYSLGAGDAFCIAAGMRHILISDTLCGDEARWSHFNLRVFGNVDISHFLKIPVIFRGDMAHKIGELNEHLGKFNAPHGEKKALPLSQLLQQQALCCELAALFVGAADADERTAQMSDDLRRLAPVFVYMEENLTRSLSREELARQLHVSSSRFYVIFKNAMQISPADYVQNLRLQRAQHLLLDTDKSVAEVSAAAGYGDMFHFSRTFKKRFGVSPMQYRQQARIHT